jgi:DNA-binding response OmpR family regulator
MTAREVMTGDIFVVEDDPQIAAMLADFLEDEGYRVRTGVNGSALVAALAEPPSLVLLDMMMPGLDGIEFCRRFRDNPATAQTPVVFVTAAPPEVFEARLRTINYQHLIRKPFTLSEILTTVQRYIGDEDNGTIREMN